MGAFQVAFNKSQHAYLPYRRISNKHKINMTIIKPVCKIRIQIIQIYSHQLIIQVVISVF